MSNGINTSAPKIVGIIMDGNGRWASEKGLARSEGHKSGFANMLTLARHAFLLGVENLACYALSADNLKRNKTEIDNLFGIVINYANPFVDFCRTNRIAVKIIGNKELLPNDVQRSLAETENTLSRFADGGRTLYIAIAYGGRAEIVNAVNKAVNRKTPFTEESFLKALSFPYDFDLIIRTGGENRLSNFFLYQASYSELYFSDKYFPDFLEEDLERVFDWFSMRNRRYGL